MSEYFIWVIRNNLSSTLLIPDLNKPHGLKIGPYRSIALHKFFTLSTLQESKSLQEALRHQQISNVQIVLPEQYNAQDNFANNKTIEEMQSNLNKLTEMFGNFISNQQSQTLSEDALAQLFKKIDSISNVAPKDSKRSIHSGLSPEMAALKAREKVESIKKSNFETIGDKIEITTNELSMSDIEKINLDDINLDDV